MKKTTLLLLIAVLSISLLSSCHIFQKGDDTTVDDGASNDGGNASLPGISLMVSKYDLYLNRGELLNDIYAKVGTIPVFFTDEAAEIEGVEIVFGDTDREITRQAYDYLEELELTSNDATYLIYRKNNKTAIIWTHPAICAEEAKNYFLSQFIAQYGYYGKNAMVHFTTSAEEYEREIEDARWAKIEGKVSDEALANLKRIYALYGDATWQWIANLYDPDIGGFYYSNSARDYYASGTHQFLPDVESTGHAFGVLRNGGMFAMMDGRYQDALSPEIKEALGNFVYNLQDEDGFFYHPQWGKDITDDCRGRNLGSATAILNRLGITPNYPLPTDQAASSSYSGDSYITSPIRESSSVVAVSAIVPTANSFSDYLQSEEAFLAHLKSLDFKTNSYASGHHLSSNASLIKAAGLAEVCIAYLDSIQLPSNGLWEPEIDYDTISGFLKISTTYQTLRGKLHYTDKAVESAMSLVLSESAPNAMTRLYNPLTAVVNIINNLNRQDYKEEIATIRAYVSSVADELIEITYKKLLLFYRGDGSFSYYQKTCSPVSQGNIVAIECAEGDLNSTSLSTGVVSDIFKLLNLSMPNIFDNTDLDGFVSLLNSMGSVVKTNYDQSEVISTPPTATFDEDIEIPENISANLAGAVNGSGVKIVSDPHEAGNKVLEFISLPGYGQYLYMNRISSTATTPNCFVFSCDIDLAQIKNVTTVDFRIILDGLYQLEFNGGSNGKVTINDNSNKGSSSYKNTLPFTLQVGNKYNLVIKYHLVGTVAYIEIFVDGQLKYTSNNYMGRSKSFSSDEQPAAGTSYKRAYIFAMKDSNIILRLDNIFLDRIVEDYVPDFDNVEEEEEDDVVVQNPDTAGPPETVTFEESTKLPPSVKADINAAGSGYEIIKNSETNNSYLVFNSAPGANDFINFTRTGSTATGDANCFVFSFDLNLVDVKNGTTSDLRIELSKLYRLDINATSGTAVLVDHSGQSSGSYYSNTLPVKISTGKFYSFVIKYHIVGDVAFIETFIDGKLVYVSNNYYGRSPSLSDEDQKKAATTFTTASFVSLKAAEFTVYIDNVTLDRIEDNLFSPPDMSKRPVGAVTFDYSSDLPKGVTSSVASESGSVTLVGDTKEGDEGLCVLLSTTKGGTDTLTVELGEVTSPDGKVFVLEADLCLANSTVNQTIGRIDMGIYSIDILTRKNSGLVFQSRYEDVDTDIYTGKQGVWFKFRAEIYVLGDTARVITSINGNVIEDITISYKGAAYKQASFYSLKDSNFKFYIDDVYVDIIDKDMPPVTEE